MKRIIFCFLSAMIMLAAMVGISTSKVNAASFPSINSSKTVEFIANKSINVYTNSSLGARGTSSPYKSYNAYVDANDKCYIHAVAGNNSLLISYPTSSGYKKGYCRRTDVLYTNEPAVNYTARVGVSTYKRPGGEKYGSIAVNDYVHVCAEVSGYKGVIYPISGGKFKFGWIRENNLYTMLGLTDVTQSFSGKKVTLKSVENGKYLCADTSLTNSPAVCNRNSASTASSSWEAFSVTVTADKWAGFKAYNGKWLSATIDATDAPVRAVANNLYAWECFRIYKRGSDYFLLSQANKKWLCVRVDQNNAPVQALVDTPQNWERFAIASVTTVAPSTNTSNNTGSSIWQMPMSNAYVCGNNWLTYYKARPDRPYHLGLDLASGNGDSNVYAASNGTVAATGYNSANGNYVILKHTLNGKTVYSFYCHLSSYNVAKNSTISRGQKIGVYGNTGTSSAGAHLHFAIMDRLNSSGGYYGYGTISTGDRVTYNGTTFYNPHYVIRNGKLP